MFLLIASFSEDFWVKRWDQNSGYFNPVQKSERWEHSISCFRNSEVPFWREKAEQPSEWRKQASKTVKGETAVVWWSKTGLCLVLRLPRACWSSPGSVHSWDPAATHSGLLKFSVTRNRNCSLQLELNETVLLQHDCFALHQYSVSVYSVCLYLFLTSVTLVFNIPPNCCCAKSFWFELWELISKCQ